MDIEISEMRPRDCELVAALVQAAAVAADAFDSADKLEAMLRRHPNLSLVMREGDAIMGAGLCIGQPGRGMVQQVVLAKEATSPDAERFLVDAMICKLERRHVPVADLHMRQNAEEQDDFWRAVRWSDRPELPRPIQKCIEVDDPTNPFDAKCEFAAAPDAAGATEVSEEKTAQADSEAA